MDEPVEEQTEEQNQEEEDDNESIECRNCRDEITYDPDAGYVVVNCPQCGTPNEV